MFFVSDELSVFFVTVSFFVVDVRPVFCVVVNFFVSFGVRVVWLKLSVSELLVSALVSLTEFVCLDASCYVWQNRNQPVRKLIMQPVGI